MLRRVPGLGLYLACVNAAAFLAFAADKARAPSAPRFAWGVPVLLALQCALLAWGSAMG